MFYISSLNDEKKKLNRKKLYQKLISLISYKFGDIYFEKEKNYELAEKMINSYLKFKDEPNMTLTEINAYIILYKINYEKEKYIQSYEIMENLNKLMNKSKEDQNLDSALIHLCNDLNLLKFKSLKKYIENQLNSTKFIDLERYLDILFDLKEKVKDDLSNIKEIENTLYSFRIEYTKKKLIDLKERKKYKSCIKLCDEYILIFSGDKNFTREIKQIKLDCLNKISDNLIKKIKRMNL